MQDTRMHDTDMRNTLQHLFRYKAWANDQLLTALAGPGGASAVTGLVVKALSRLVGLRGASPVTGLAIKALSHSYIVDRIFAAHLRRQPHAYTSANASVLPTLEALSADIRQSDREYVDYVAALDRDELAERIDFAFTDGAPGRMSRAEMLLHVINHGTGHRGQVSALMLLNGVAPAKDGFTTWLHEAEASARRRSAA